MTEHVMQNGGQMLRPKLPLPRDRTLSTPMEAPTLLSCKVVYLHIRSFSLVARCWIYVGIRRDSRCTMMMIPKKSAGELPPSLAKLSKCWLYGIKLRSARLATTGKALVANRAYNMRGAIPKSKHCLILQVSWQDGE